MYRIALCEDETIFSNAEEDICRDILERLQIEYHISTFDNSIDLLNALSRKEGQYDLLLLDIVMEGMDGMTLARRIREIDDEVRIIFITSSINYTLQGYDVNALHYLMKPVDKAKLAQLIDADYKSRFLTQYVVLDSKAGKERIALKRIVCLETVGRRVEVTLTDGTVYYSGRLTVLLDELPKDKFVRCHQSFAINMANIRELTPQDAIGVNGKQIPVSRSFSKNVQKAFARQLREG